MFSHLLIAFDGSPSARKALNAALDSALAFRARLSIVSVEEQLPHFPGEVGEVKEERDRQNAYFASIQREARDTAKLRGLDFHRADVLTGHVAQAIISHAQAIGCDLIVVGHSGRSGVWATLLGTTAERVSRHAHCSVVIVR